ncbi:class I SAM-dependent methyltransferase [Rhodoblastus acidophilus]|nr:class I SAM-dependent methyltransferase [Rhodoblastus acidophilus]PPQ38793.1 class I SAM-dependent methyltransferase [Rhodoblastus acidophilus]RAI20447.1 hypothetical protein CH337_09525 [Rhodoblastus acidophilus]
MKILELGTGWTSTYGIIPSLARQDCKFVCFDVKDIRHTCSKFKESLNYNISEYFSNEGRDSEISKKIVRAISKDNIDDIYSEFGVDYCVNEEGVPPYRDGEFDVIYSFDVLEHIPADAFSRIAKKWYDILRPGGRFMARVSLCDHTSYWADRSIDKRYLGYSQSVWRNILENDVQYINRLSASQIVEIIEDVGFVTLEKSAEQIVGDFRVHPSYKWQSDTDLRALSLLYIGKKP